jgi:hypothetical protein
MTTAAAAHRRGLLRHRHRRSDADIFRDGGADVAIALDAATDDSLGVTMKRRSRKRSSGSALRRVQPRSPQATA